jgi:hypothetical protein
MKTINRLCLYSICIILIVAFLTPAWGASPDKPGITSASIKEKKLKRGTKVTIFKSDLVDSRYAIMEGTAVGGQASVKKVEVSLDNGSTWNEATGKEAWQYKFSPAPNYKYYLTFRVTSVKGVVSSPGEFGTTHLTYLPITLSGLIQQQANELAKAYMSKRLEKYMGLISKDYKNYPRGRHKLRKSIQNDFRSLNNIVLRFTVNQVFKLDKVIMAEIHWTLTHAQLTEPEEGDVEIHFDPADQLKVIVQKKDLYFGEAVIGHNGRIQLEENTPFVEVTVTDLDMVGAGVATVRGRGNCDASPPFNGTIRLTETPPRSGRFFGRVTCPLNILAVNYFTATYIDKITTDWRRNVRRTTRIQ